MKTHYRLGAGIFTTAVNTPEQRTCEVCAQTYPAHLRIDTEGDAGLIHSYCFVHYKQVMGIAIKRKPTSFSDLPSTVSFTTIEARCRQR